MATIIIKDGSGSSRYVQASGSGLSASPYIPHHAISDGAGGVLGLSGSPLVVSGALSLGSAASVIQSTPNSIANAWPVDLTDGVDTISIDSASRLTVVASATITNTVSASIANTLTAQASILNVSIDSASRMLTVASAVVTNGVSASISNTLTASAIQGTGAAITAPWSMRLSDSVDSAAIDSASRLTVAASAEITNQVSASISNTLTVGNQISASISNTLTASAIQGTAAPITAPWSVRMSDGTDSAAIDSASRQLVAASAEITNRVSASISNTVTVDQASAPWGVRLLDTGGNAYGVSAASPIYITGGAAGGTSANDRAAYAEGTTSYTPTGGLYQPTPQALTASQAGAVRMTAYRGLHTRLSDDSGNILGVSGSPLYVTGISGGAGGSSMVITDTVDNVAVDSASRLLTQASAVITNVVSASISNVLTAQASLLNVSIDSASRLQTVASAVVTNQVSASISNTLTTTGSAIVTNQVSASISNTLTASAIQGTGAAITAPWSVRISDTVDSVAVDSASRLTVAASAEITNQVSASISNTLTVGNQISASISNTLTASAIQGTAAPITAPWSVRMSDGTDSAAIDSASRQLVAASAEITNRVSASISNTVTVDQASAPWGVRLLDTGGNAYGVSAASPIYISGGAAGGTSATDRASYAEGTTSYTPVGGLYQPSPAALTASQAGAVRMTAFRGLHVSLRDESGNILGISGSPLVVTGGAAGGSSMSITNGTDTVDVDSASRLLTVASAVITNVVSASIGNVLTTQASLLNVSIDSASRMLTVASAVVTNQVSASISNTLTASAIQGTGAAITAPWTVRISDAVDSVSVDSASRLTVAASAVVTNIVSASISNTLTASAIQGTPAAYAAAWPMRITDGTDGAAVTTASGQHVNLRSNGGNELGVSGSPIAVAADNTIYVSGSLFTPVSLGFSGSTAGSSVVIAGVSGCQIRVLSMTFTTTASQLIGWQSGSAGTAASTIPAMGFANFGGMDVNRLPHGYLLQTGNGSALVISQTTACYVRGSITYVVVPQ